MKKATFVYDRVQQKAKYNIPAAHCREIGRIIVRWAFYEQHMQYLIWAVTLSPDLQGAALGRLAIRECRPDDQLSLLESVCDVKGIKYDNEVFKRIRKRAVKLVEKRNLIAHGIWTDPIQADWSVQQTRGSWEQSAHGPKGKKKITPQAVPLSIKELHDINVELEALIKDAAELKKSLHT